MNAYPTSQMKKYYSRSINARINRIHERTLRIVYNDNNSSFDELLVKSGSVKIHHRNSQLLAIEIYKAFNNLSSSLMTELFQPNSINYNLRKCSTLTGHNIKTLSYGIKTVSYLGSKIWNLLPGEIKKCKSLDSFKQTIKSWIPDFPCILCKQYVENLGFII